ncbi:helix-turn-helix transcriptional regulator [Oceanobacter mangrovi]|uniref:helix-turn-helix transcriptional regulator n=1 Tax=Oceanobacter mangrovi TaxID=2862510 RepID=UPI001C8F07B5|nr:helix-turn-helix transcriptional regulator [Oceanobacter mangrovi]
MFVESLLSDLYGAVQQPQQWPSVLDQIKQEFSVGNVAVQLFQRHNDRLNEVWTVRDSESTEMAEWHDQVVNNADNPRLDARYLAGIPALLVFQEPDSSPAEPGEFQQLRQRLALIGLGRSLSVTMDLGTDQYLSLIMHRRLTNNDEFEVGAGQLLTRIAPHLRQTVQLQQQVIELQQQQQNMTSALDTTATATLLVLPDGRLEWMNQSARDGLELLDTLQLQHGRLRCRQPQDQQRLLQTLTQASQCQQQQRFYTRLDGDPGNPLYLMACRLPTAAQRPVLLLNLSGLPRRGGASIDTIRTTFGLTPAESRLAASLCNGLTLQDHADRYQVSVGTVRIQLKSIFLKLGVNRQAELVSKISSTMTALSAFSIG